MADEASVSDSPVQLVSTPGGRIYVDERDRGSVAQSLLSKGKYEKNWTWWLKSTLKPGWRVLDIGANIGYYTALMATRVGPAGLVVACEPDSHNASLLRRTVSENGFTQVRVVEAAVAARPGRTTLFHDTAWHGVHSLALDNCVNGGESSAEVETITLDLLVTEAESFDLVKIDAQGAEGLILQAASAFLAQPHGIVLIELWPHGLSALGSTLTDVTEPFRSHGFASYYMAANRELVPISQTDIESRAARLGRWSSFNLVWQK